MSIFREIGHQIYIFGTILMAWLRLLFDLCPDIVALLAFSFAALAIFVPKILKKMEKNKKIVTSALIMVLLIGLAGFISNLVQRCEQKKAIESERNTAKTEMEKFGKQSEMNFQDLNNKFDQYLFYQTHKEEEIKASRKIEKESKLKADFIAEAELIPGLKSRAFSLSSQIGHFLVDRRSNEPPLPKMDRWEEYTDKLISYSKDTVSQYSSQFAPQVTVIRNEFARKGLRDKELDKYYEYPKNPMEIRIIAEHIQALAEQIH